MQLEVSFFATLRRIVGTKTEVFELSDDAPLAELVDLVIERHPDLREALLDEAGGLSRHVHVFVDGRSSKHLPEGLATPLRGDHRVDFFPAVAGG